MQRVPWALEAGARWRVQKATCRLRRYLRRRSPWRRSGGVTRRKNTGAKLVQHSLNRHVAEHVARNAHVAQRGFVEVLEADTVAHVQALRVGAERRTSLGVARARDCGLPTVFHPVCVGALRGVVIALVGRRRGDLFSLVTAGVFQWRPFGGAIFVVAIGSLVATFGAKIPIDEGSGRAYSDGIAAIAGDLLLLLGLAPVFAKAERCGALLGEAAVRCLSEGVVGWMCRITARALLRETTKWRAGG